MEHRFVLFETGHQPEIYKVPLNRTARLVNQYPDRKVAVFETLKEATAAALAVIGRAEAQARSRISVFATQASPESEALRRRFSELTEDRVETFNP
jgi:hypothetical protein